MDNTFSWSLTIDGKLIEEGLRQYVERISFNKTRDIMAELTLELKSPLVDDNTKTRYIFARGKEVVLFAGWGRETFIGAGIINSFEVDIQGQRLVVKALDKGKAFAKKHEKETFKNTKDSDIAKKIAGKYGVETDIGETTATVSRVQSGTTDFEFLRDLAARNGYEFYFEYDTGSRKWVMHFHSPRLVHQEKMFVYDYSQQPSSPVISFSPQVSGEVEHKAGLKLVAFLNEERGPAVFETKVAGDASVREVISGLWFQNGKEAQAFIDGLAKQRNETYMTATASVLGNEKLGVGEIHTFKGVTPKFFVSLDGDYRINSYTHKLNPGGEVMFTTDLDLYRVK